MQTLKESDIPDINFRKALVELFKFDKIECFTIEICQSVKILSLYGKNIESLQGIEHFPNIETLNCKINNLTSLDLSKNTKIIYLCCTENGITNLNLSNNIDILFLYCSDNKLKQLDLSNNTKIRNLSCRFNDLEILDLSNNIEILDGAFLFNSKQSIYCTLDITNNPIHTLILNDKINETCLYNAIIKNFDNLTLII